MDQSEQDTPQEDAGYAFPPPIDSNRPGAHNSDIMFLIQHMQASQLQEQIRRKQED